MAPFISPSRQELVHRRQQLRQRRRNRSVQSIWRVILVSCLAVAIVWGALLPIWVIYRPQQIIIQGNQLLSTQTIYALLSIRYPQRLITIKPDAIAQTLKSQAPIGEVSVIRQLFPPALIIRIQERRPVAIAQQSGTLIPGQPIGVSQSGLLDERGNWISMQNITKLNQPIQMPQLTVFGNLEQYHTQWAAFYSEIRKSPVKISEVDWRDPNNLVLVTELGLVQLGEFSPRLAQQLLVLDRMRQFPEKVDMTQVQYINLKNPMAPSLQMVPTTAPPTVSSLNAAAAEAISTEIPLDPEYFAPEAPIDGNDDPAYEQPTGSYTPDEPALSPQDESNPSPQ